MRKREITRGEKGVKERKKNRNQKERVRERRIQREIKRKREGET